MSEGTTMTCLVCGAHLDDTSTACPSCGEPVLGRAEDGASNLSMAGGTAGPSGAGGGHGSGTAGVAENPTPGDSWTRPAHPSGLSGEVRGWAVGAHLGGLLAGFATAATLGFLGPLLVWLLKRETHPFIDHHGKESLNFHITVVLALVAGSILVIPMVVVGVLTLGLGVLVAVLAVAVAMVLWVALPIIGAVKASNGEAFHYPLTIRFVR